MNWTRHRNPDLWGDDVNIFNPHRNFKGEESYGIIKDLEQLIHPQKDLVHSLMVQDVVLVKISHKWK